MDTRISRMFLRLRNTYMRSSNISMPAMLIAMMLSLLMRRAFSAAMTGPPMICMSRLLFSFSVMDTASSSIAASEALCSDSCAPNADSRITMAFFASGERIYPSYVSKLIDIPPFFNLSGTGEKRLSGSLDIFPASMPDEGKSSICLSSRICRSIYPGSDRRESILA
ncbi:hypothetical protein IMSAGC016_01642 [Muribaculaceae bacterium]|nr:hypothetical protein IMSAGC016_01642 [Muribaculaceae bacterium]